MSRGNQKQVVLLLPSKSPKIVNFKVEERNASAFELSSKNLIRSSGLGVAETGIQISGG
jgi:hypothetical protein